MIVRLQPGIMGLQPGYPWLQMSLLASAMLAAVSACPVDEVEKLLPPALQAGLFAAIGWSLYLL